MTTSDPSCCEPRPSYETKCFDCLCGVARATWLKTAKWPQQRRQSDSVESQQPQGDFPPEATHRKSAIAQLALPVRAAEIIALRTLVTSQPERPRAARQAITTTSDPSGSHLRACRNHSLIRRFIWLRITAFPTRLLTVTPNLCRLSSDFVTAFLGLRAITTIKPSEVPGLPDLRTRLKSRGDRTRSTRRKRCVS